jgi:hypothetical protein
MNSPQQSGGGFSKAAGSRQDTTGRFEVNNPGFVTQNAMISRPVGDRNYDVQYPTGYSVSTVPTGSWARGQIIRQFQPTIHPPMLGYYAYDPTDPTSWAGNAN